MTRRIALLVGLALIAGLALLMPRQVTSAYWTSNGSTSTGTLTTGSVPTLSGGRCEDAGAGRVTLSWNGLGPRYRYEVRYYRAGGQIGTTTAVAATSASTVNTTIGRSDVGLTVASNVEARVVAVAAQSGSWNSATVLTIPIQTVLVGVLGVHCGHATTLTLTVTLGVDTGVSATDGITGTRRNSVRGTGDPGSVVSLRRAGDPLGDVTVAEDGTWSLPVDLIEGSQNLVVTATRSDLADVTVTASLTVVLDTVAPTITQTSTCTSAGNAVAGHAGQNWCRQTTRALTASYSDPGGSGVVTSTEALTVGGIAAASATAATLGEGSAITVVSTASDVAGNTGSSTGQYWNDGTAPTVTIRAPAPSASIASLALRAMIQNVCGTDTGGCGTASDAVSAVATTTFEMRKSTAGSPTTCLSTGGTYAEATCGVPQTPGGSATAWRLQPTAENTFPYATVLTSFTLTVTSTDAAGNVGTAQVVVATLL